MKRLLLAMLVFRGGIRKHLEHTDLLSKTVLTHCFLTLLHPSVIMDVMLSQPCSKILVGDPHQQIYTFRGAVNALKQVEHTHIYYLTQVGAGAE